MMMASKMDVCCLCSFVRASPSLHHFQRGSKCALSANRCPLSPGPKFRPLKKGNFFPQRRGRWLLMWFSKTLMLIRQLNLAILPVNPLVPRVQKIKIRKLTAKFSGSPSSGVLYMYACVCVLVLEIVDTQLYRVLNFIRRLFTYMRVRVCSAIPVICLWHMARFLKWQ